LTWVNELPGQTLCTLAPPLLAHVQVTSARPGRQLLVVRVRLVQLELFHSVRPLACPTVCTRIRCISESFCPVFLLLLFLGPQHRPGRPETIPHEPALRCRLAASNVSPSLPSPPCPRSGLPRYSCCWLSLSLPLAHRQLRLAQLYVTALLEDPLRF